MERGASTERVTIIAAEVNARGGSTNATAVTTGRSGSWQQDIEQSVRPLIWWSQSAVPAVFEAGCSRVFW